MLVADIDDCDPYPCVNGNICVDLVNDYNCICLPGYIGKNCSVGKVLIYTHLYRLILPHIDRIL